MSHLGHWLTTQRYRGREKNVGVLGASSITQKSSMSAEDDVFISHTGQDKPNNVKELFARPAYWFLKQVIGVNACFDDGPGELEIGGEVTEELTRRAYQCTHALVILSPRFRERRMCVKELNTFMRRLQSNDGIRVVLVMWEIDNLEGYHDQLGELVRFPQSKTNNPVEFLVQTLWPELLRLFRQREMQRPELERYLDNYIASLRGTRVHIAHPFDQFAHRTGASVGIPLVLPEEHYGEEAVIRGSWAALLAMRAILRGMLDIIFDWNVRKINLKTPKKLCGKDLSEMHWKKRSVKGSVSALFSRIGNATLTVGGKPTNVDLTVVKLPQGVRGLRDEHVPVRKGKIEILLVAVLVGNGRNDMRLVSCFRRDFDCVIVFDGRLSQPTIPDPRVRWLKHMTAKIWMALALSINGYCISFWPEKGAGSLGFICMILAMALAHPFLMATAAGRSSDLSIEELDPWEIVGGDRHLGLDAAILAFFALVGYSTRDSSPETLMQGFCCFAHFLVFAINLKFWWFLCVPLESSRMLLPWFSGSAILTGTLVTMWGAPRLMENLSVAAIVAILINQLMIYELIKRSPRSLLSRGPMYFATPILTVVGVNLTTTDNLALMRQDGEFYANSELHSRFTAFLATLISIGLQLWFLREELGSIDNIFHREFPGWGVFRWLPSPSRVSLGSGSVELTPGHQDNAAKVQVWDGQSSLESGLFE